MDARSDPGALAACLRRLNDSLASMLTERRGQLAAIGLGFLLLGLALGALVLTILNPGSVFMPLAGIGAILGACLLLWAVDAWAASVVAALRKQRETEELTAEGIRCLLYTSPSPRDS